jgi:hypothetical protein
MKRISSHIHGHKFWIVERSSNFSSTDPAVITRANLKNPLARDVILIESGGSATLRCVSGIRQFCEKKLIPDAPPDLSRTTQASGFSTVTSSGIWRQASRSSSSKRHLSRRLGRISRRRSTPTARRKTSPSAGMPQGTRARQTLPAYHSARSRLRLKCAKVGHT